jgi:hypothetical protein
LPVSKNVVEVSVVIGEPPDSIRVATVVMVKKGDLYISHVAPNVITSKHSYHESGISHTYVDLIQRRTGEGEPAGQQLRGMKDHLLVDGWGCPEVLEPTGYQPKPDTQVRRTLIAPKAEIGWFCFVWAIERGREGLVDRICQTSPWPAIPIVASLLADWSDPWILVTVCHWMSRQPYQVVKYSPPIAGRVPFVFIPEAFEGTWLERPGPKWRQGKPFPEEWLRDAREYIARQKALDEKRTRDRSPTE